MKHTIQALVENKFGVLSRISSLFSARGYNIDSLTVGETQDPTISCMTIVVNAKDENILEQIKKQLHKLIDVITVVDFTRKEYIERELLLVKTSKGDGKIVEKLAKDYPLKITEDKKDYYIMEVCACTKDVDEILEKLKDLEIKELVRTGKLAISK
jgi:acetolactate synthase-1/3 small subunit